MALLMAVFKNKIYKKYFLPKKSKNNIENSLILFVILGDTGDDGDDETEDTGGPG